MRATFWKAVVICLAVVVGLGLVIHWLNAGHHRPEGAAEHWLSAISDSGRSGVRTDALERASDIGPPALARGLVQGVDTGGKHGLFSDLEVGRADGNDTEVRVPFRLHQYRAQGKNTVVTGAVVLRRTGDTWHVTGLSPRTAGEAVPSEGGPPPSSASWGVWLIALAIGCVLALLTSVLVRWADRSARAALLTAG
jgi:hypothetical protein